MSATVDRHTPLEDFQALLTGTLFISLAVMMFNQTGLLTGGTAGLAFLLHYATGWGFGRWFFLINLPFYWIAWRRMGRAFTFKTFAEVRGRRFRRYAELVEKRHWLFGIGALLLMLFLAIPAMSMREGFPDGGSNPPGDPQRIAYSLVGALALNLTLAINHKPGRYVAM